MYNTVSTQMMTMMLGFVEDLANTTTLGIRTDRPEQDVASISTYNIQFHGEIIIYSCVHSPHMFRDT